MKHKLTYWDVRGRAEPIRMIFAFANVEFEDFRISKENDWSQYKPLMPWNQVPVLEVGDQVLAQSLTICRYLADNFGLAGITAWEAAKCDEYTDAISDLIPEMKKIAHEKDSGKKVQKTENFISAILPSSLSKFEKILESNASVAGDLHLVGKQLTWADIFVSTMLDRVESYAGQSYVPENYPKLHALRIATYNQPGIKEYIASSRPSK